MNRSRRKILRLHQRHFQCERGTRRMAKKINASRVDRVFGLQFLNKIAQVIWTILRRTPTTEVCGIRSCNDDSLLLGEVLPFLDKGSAGPARTVKHKN